MKAANVIYLLCAAMVISGNSSSTKQDARQQSALELELAGEMVSIPGGTFRMGDLSGSLTKALSMRGKEIGWHKPVHRVEVPAFKLSKHEVTFAQWDACMADGGCNGYIPGDAGWGRGSRPVVNVSWDDAQFFIEWLNSKTDGNYRLPTEAEWEYAARAGTTTKYSWGDDIGNNQANCYDDYCGDSWDYTAPVGSFPANPWGLHDMHGNVYEWVQDCWHDNYEGAPTDGSAWTNGHCGPRVMRGGDWFNDAWSLRSANRVKDDRAASFFNIGFRLAQDEQD
ncbi:MAG: formylglycine-generating enzyme family protein [Gammaproteobacteria bacterium]|nr:formylglycine-generating enzyme family protein [Gammaproteobacteria bacterium]